MERDPKAKDQKQVGVMETATRSRGIVVTVIGVVDAFVGDVIVGVNRAVH